MTGSLLQSLLLNTWKAVSLQIFCSACIKENEFYCVLSWHPSRIIDWGCILFLLSVNGRFSPRYMRTLHTYKITHEQCIWLWTALFIYSPLLLVIDIWNACTKNGSSEPGSWQKGLGVSSNPYGSDHPFPCSLGHPASPVSSLPSLPNSCKPLVEVFRPLDSHG